MERKRGIGYNQSHEGRSQDSAAGGEVNDGGETEIEREGEWREERGEVEMEGAWGGWRKRKNLKKGGREVKIKEIRRERKREERRT